nr:MAG: hypothetical protein OI716_00750 [Candidatus Methanoperedens sp.]WAI00077.1 MAG: hypothetical protein OI720_00595 [Candidatus Methanoperedens sp.]
MNEVLEITDRVGSYLKWSSMADNAIIGLEYLHLKQDNDRTKSLLEEGLRLCEIFEEEITYDTIIDDSKLEAYNAISSLVAISDEPTTIDDKKMKELTKNAKKIKIQLQKAIDKNENYSEKDIRTYQQFFNRISAPFLKKAFKDIARIENIRRVPAKCIC